MTAGRASSSGSGVWLVQLTSDNPGPGLAATEGLYPFTTRLLQAPDLQAVLDEILDTVIELTAADKGSIQLLDAAKGGLEMRASRGMPAGFVHRYGIIRADEPSSWTPRVLQGERVVVEDIESDAEYAYARPVAAEAGFRAFQSTPFRTIAGEILGIVSTNFAGPHRPSTEELQLVDLYVRQAADVVERLQREEALRASEARYRALSELSPIAILVNQDMRWVYANSAAARMFGAASQADLVGRSPFDLIVPAFHDFARERIRRVLDGEGPNPLVEQQWVRLDGSLVDCEVASVAISWQGRPAIQLVCRDITERKQAEAALREAGRLKDEFLALVSHELRTPLTTIRGYAAVLSRHAALPEEAKQAALHDLVTESERLSRLVENMLVLARMEAGQKAPAEPLIAGRALRLAAERFSAGRPDARVVVAAPAKPSIALAVPEYVEQVLQNLISNAYKYSPPDSDIVLSAEPEGQYVRFDVADRGRGVTNPDEVFSPFVRESGAAAVAAGLGIGLTVCKRLVEAQGGEIRVSAREGGGTVVSFTLPREESSD
jgi:PAS domain S-box-containing protein